MKGLLRDSFALAFPLRIDRVLLATLLGSAVVAGGTLYIGSRLPGEPRSLALDVQQVRRIVSLMPPTEQKDAEITASWLRSDPPSTAHYFRSPATVGSDSSPALARAAAHSSGILGVLRGGAAASIFARDSALGSDASDALGGLVGTVVGEGYVGVGIGVKAREIGISAHAGFGFHVGRRRPAELPRPVEKIAASEDAAAQVAVRAGEWDDNANYREFQKFLASRKRDPFVHLDVSHRRFLVVRDVQGRAVPRCRVQVSDELGNRVALRTGPSGRAILFPHAEGLRSTKLQATAQCAEGAVARAFNTSAQDAAVDLQLPAARALPSSRSVDVAFILDTTGSMGEETAAMKSTLRQVVSRLSQERTSVRLALVEFKDRGDAHVTRVHEFTSDARGFGRELDAVTAGGGGDTPESVNEALHTAMTRLAWSDAAIGRFAFLIGDAPPHMDYEDDVDYTRSARQAARHGVQIFTVAASGMDTLGQIVFRQVAQYTGGVNLFVMRGGAGPQSTGAGDPKTSCGGRHEDFTSGNLDTLISSRIVRELRALDGDPLAIRGLSRDERSAPCDKRLASR